MRLSAMLSVLFVLMAVTQAVTLSKHGGEAHAAKKSKSKKAVSQGAAKKSHKDAPGAKKSHKKNRHTSTLVQAKQHEEDFGTTGGGGEEPQQAGPAPGAPPTARPAASGWSGETSRYGPCLRDFASLVSNNECAQDRLGDVEYFLETLNQEEHTLSAGYKTGMARKGMVIEGIGMNASSSEATPLTRHAFQRSRVELAYACAPVGSECKSYMTPVGEIDTSIGKDKQCPTKLMQGSDDPYLKAMRGRMKEIIQAYSTNPANYFWGDSREYASAVAVCFHVRTYGQGGSQTASTGMLLKDNIYDPAPAGVVVDLEEVLESDGNIAAGVPPTYSNGVGVSSRLGVHLGDDAKLPPEPPGGPLVLDIWGRPLSDDIFHAMVVVEVEDDDEGAHPVVIESGPGVKVYLLSQIGASLEEWRAADNGEMREMMQFTVDQTFIAHIPGCANTFPGWKLLPTTTLQFVISNALGMDKGLWAADKNNCQHFVHKLLVEFERPQLIQYDDKPTLKPLLTSFMEGAVFHWHQAGLITKKGLLASKIVKVVEKSGAGANEAADAVNQEYGQYRVTRVSVWYKVSGIAKKVSTPETRATDFERRHAILEMFCKTVLGGNSSSASLLKPAKKG